jgi:hypothetical protein
VPKLPTDCLAKLMAYHSHVMNLHQKHDYLIGPVEMLINAVIDIKGGNQYFA